MPNFSYTNPRIIAVLLLIGAVLLAGCSGSGSGSGSGVGSGSGSGSGSGVDADLSLNDGVNSTDNGDNLGTSIPDPLVQTTTRVNFNITVPAFMSDALQVRLTWGDNDFTAGWVGDELWSAMDDFPADSENTLTVFFNDDNGGITLGSVALNLRTGTSDSQVVDISADQFDIERWDNDGDGVSNLDELVAGTDALGPPRLLLFSETRGFRHESVETAIDSIEELAASQGIAIARANSSAGHFTPLKLSAYDAVVWILTSGDVLDDAEQAAFEGYIRAGGGFVGIHAASDTEYDWPWYGNLVGAYFESHPVIQTATQTVENGTHVSTAHLADTWVRTDEWYNFNENPRARVDVLLTLDEASYTGGTMGSDHPIAWFHEYDGGRSWYTGGGHTVESYSEPRFREHLLGGLLYGVGISE